MPLKVFFNELQNVKENTSLSPSAGKPKIIVEEYNKFPNLEIVSDFKPLTSEEISSAHSPQYVKQILTCQINNGFENKLESVAKSLPWTNGSFYAASEYALLNKTITCSPTSGFHHATYDEALGFCTFNGLMISAILLNKKYPGTKVGIVDIDAHYGNGTDDILSFLKIQYVKHHTFGYYSSMFKDKPESVGNEWLGRLESFILPSMFLNSNIIFYQAGADVHKNDPYGGFLTTEQMRKRDQIVFSFAEKHKIPLVWNLAGGYQEPFSKVIELHINTLKECLKFLF